MSDAAALGSAWATFKTGTLWKQYAKANPGEANTVDAYVVAVAAGGNVKPPSSATAAGKGLVGIVAAGFPYVAPPPAPSSVFAIALTADKTAVTVVSLPAGAANAEFARCADASGADPQGWAQVPVGGTFPGTPDHPYVDAVAVDAQGNPVGAWWSSSHPRIQTVPATPAPSPAPAGPFRVGTHVSYAAGGDPNLAIALGAKVVREDCDRAAFQAALGWFIGRSIDVYGNLPAGRVDLADPRCRWILCGGNEPYVGGSAVADIVAWARQTRDDAKALKADPRFAHVTLTASVATRWIATTDGGGMWTQNGVTKPWIQFMFEAAPDLASYVDLWDVHPYAGFDLDVTRRQMAALGDLAWVKPLAVSEDGYTTVTGGAADEQQQADYLASRIATFAAAPDVPLFIQYEAPDNPWTQPASEQHFGVVRADGSRKPGWQVLADAIKAHP